MQYLGDYAEDYATLNFKFSTHKADGTPITLAGSPAISVYKANGTTQSTAGITLTTDFDSVTGLHNVLIDLSADAFYAVANDYSVVITTGTVDSVSVVGTVLAHFSIENRNIKATVTSLANDVITSSAFDESTAFPLKSADTGATAVARTGADSDTLETLSDEIATAQDDLDLLTGADGATLATLQANYAPAKAGDEMTLTVAYDDAKTAAQAGDAMTLTGDYDAAKTASQAGDAMTLTGDYDAAKTAAQAGDAMTLTGDYDAAKTASQAGDAMTLADDAITSAKFDESSAFPLTASDAGATAVARVGNDSDTLETLSDEIATAQADLDLLTGADGATLATLQANYPPAVAGDAMTLTGDYDASKTAAQAGDAMTLANDAISADALSDAAVAEISDAIELLLSSSVRAELTGVPAANASLVEKLTWLTMLARNKRTQTASEETVYADNGTTALVTASASSDGTTFTKGEYTDVP